MKKVMILAIFACDFSAAYSQDLIENVVKQVVVIYGLKKEVKSLTSQSERQLRFSNDGISRLIATHKSEVDNLNKKVANAEKGLAAASKKVTALDKNKVKAERDNLQKLVDTLQADTAALNKKLAEKEGELAAAKTEANAKIREAKEQGCAEALANVFDAYTKPFNELIKSSTPQSVERDLLLVGNNESAKKKLQDLQKYFAAKQVLSKPYSEQKVHTAQLQISALEQTELVKHLAAKLGKYKLCSDGLKDVINEILDIDRKFVGNDEDTQKTKMQDISYALTRYFYDYPSFSFTDYPCLSDIVSEIMKRKQEDANTDISDLLVKL
jgi:hypothetical protein